MNSPAALDSVVLFTMLAANATIAVCGFSAWRRHRLAFLGLLGFAGLTGLLIPIIDYVLGTQWLQAAGSPWFAGVRHLALIAQFLLYAFALLSISRYFKRSAPAAVRENA